jgi:hypothetical protein
MITPLIVFAIGAVMLALAVGVGVVHVKSVANAFQTERSAYMALIQKKLATWYSLNVGMERDPSFAMSSDQLMAAIGMEQKYGVVLVLSPAISDGTVQYHKVAIVSPGPSSTSSASAPYGSYAGGGIFVAPTGFTFVEFDGKQAQYAALAATTKALDTIAALLEQYASVRVHGDANSDGANNYFLPFQGCAMPSPNELPCTNGEAPADTYLSVKSLMGGQGGVTVKNAWGGAITLNNDVSANTSEAPFSMTVSTQTPWNSTLSVKAIQPLY